MTSYIWGERCTLKYMDKIIIIDHFSEKVASYFLYYVVLRFLGFVLLFWGHTWQYSGIFFLAFHSGISSGSIWGTLGDRSWIGCMQSKHSICYTISLASFKYFQNSPPPFFLTDWDFVVYSTVTSNNGFSCTLLYSYYFYVWNYFQIKNHTCKKVCDLIDLTFIKLQ